MYSSGISDVFCRPNLYWVNLLNYGYVFGGDIRVVASTW